MLRQRPVGHEARLAHSSTSETGHWVLCGTLCRTDMAGRTELTGGRWAGGRMGLGRMCGWVRMIRDVGRRLDQQWVCRGKELRVDLHGGRVLQHLCTLAALLI